MNILQYLAISILYTSEKISKNIEPFKIMLFLSYMQTKNGKKAKYVELNRDFNIGGFYSILENPLGSKENISISFESLTGSHVQYTCLVWELELPFMNSSI